MVAPVSEFLKTEDGELFMTEAKQEIARIEDAVSGADSLFELLRELGILPTEKEYVRTKRLARLDEVSGIMGITSLLLFLVAIFCSGLLANGPAWVHLGMLIIALTSGVALLAAAGVHITVNKVSPKAKKRLNRYTNWLANAKDPHWVRDKLIDHCNETVKRYEKEIADDLEKAAAVVQEKVDAAQDIIGRCDVQLRREDLPEEMRERIRGHRSRAQRRKDEYTAHITAYKKRCGVLRGEVAKLRMHVDTLSLSLDESLIASDLAKLEGEAVDVLEEADHAILRAFVSFQEDVQRIARTFTELEKIKHMFVDGTGLLSHSELGHLKPPSPPMIARTSQRTTEAVQAFVNSFDEVPEGA